MLKGMMVQRLVAACIAVMCFVGTAWSQTSVSNPLPHFYEDFRTQNPVGWSFNNIFWNSNEGVDNSACYRGSGSSATVRTIITPYVTVGANYVLQFSYRATQSTSSSGNAGYTSGSGAPANSVRWTVAISTDDGLTWTNVQTGSNFSSASFETITVSSALNNYRNQTVRVRITFEIIQFAWIFLTVDDIFMGTQRTAIFSGATTLAAGTIFSSFPSLETNKRTYEITNTGNQPLIISNVRTNGGVSVSGLSGLSIPAWSSRTVNVDINAQGSGSSYNGSFSFSTNDPVNPNVTVNVTGTVSSAPNGMLEPFTGSGVPTGWVFWSNRTGTGVDFQHTSTEGVGGSGGIFANFTSANTGTGLTNNPTISWATERRITTSNVAVGANPIFSFKYRTTIGRASTSAVAEDAMRYSVEASRDGGETWELVQEMRDIISSEGFTTEDVGLPSSFAHQVIRIRVTFERKTDCFLWLDDFEIRGGHIITFNANGGTVFPLNASTQAGVRTISFLPTPTRSGYEFTGWFTTATGSTAVTLDRQYTGNTTIWAQWALSNCEHSFVFNRNTESATCATNGIGLHECTKCGLHEYRLANIIPCGNANCNICSNGEITALNSEIAGLEADTLRLFNQISGLKTDTTNLIADTLRLFGERNQLRTDSTMLANKLDADTTALKLIISQKDETIGDLEDEIWELNSEKTALEGTNSTLSANLSILQGENATLTSTNSTLATEKANLQADTLRLFNANSALATAHNKSLDSIDVLLRELAECRSVSVSEIRRSDDRHGIRFAENIVSDKAEMSVILPNNEVAVETNIAIYDMTGNVVWASTGSATGGAIVWNLRNSAGRFVANGTYLVIAEVKDRNGRMYQYSAKLGVKR